MPLIRALRQELRREPRLWSKLDQAGFYDICVVDENTIIVAGHKGIYKSNDKGKTWKLKAAYDSNPRYRCFTLLLTNRGTLLAGSQAYGAILRSEDKGETWSVVFESAPTDSAMQIRSLSQALFNPNYDYPYIYASQYGAKGRNLYRSDDDGKTWTLIYSFTEFDDHVHVVLASKFLDGTVYVAGGDSGTLLLKSTDNGVSWSPWTNGSTALLATALAESAAYRFIGSDSYGFIARTKDDTDVEIVHHSGKDGRIWFNCLRYDPRGYLIAGEYNETMGNIAGSVLISKDQGDTWHEFIQVPYQGVHGVDTSPDGFLYVASHGLTGQLRRFPLPPPETLKPTSKRMRIFATTFYPYAPATLTTGSRVSLPLMLLGYSSKTFHFQSDQAGTLLIEVYTLTGNWRTYDSLSVVADTLLSYVMTGNAVLARITFTPTAYPATISDAEVVLLA